MSDEQRTKEEILASLAKMREDRMRSLARRTETGARRSQSGEAQASCEWVISPKSER